MCLLQLRARSEPQPPSPLGAYRLDGISYASPIFGAKVALELGGSLLVQEEMEGLVDFACEPTIDTLLTPLPSASGAHRRSISLSASGACYPSGEATCKLFGRPLLPL